jgi:cold shock CspA family protein
MTSLLQKINELDLRIDNISTSEGGGTTDTTALQNQIDINASDISTLQTDKMSTLIAGDNITFVDNVISASDGSSSVFIGFRVETIGDTNATIIPGQRIPFNSKNGLFLFDTENAYNTSTFGYTIPVSGYWSMQVSLFVGSDPTLTQRRMTLTVNRNNVLYTPCVTGQYSGYSNNITTIIPLLIGDEIYATTQLNPLNIFKSDNNCWFNGQFLGQ